MKKMLTVLWQMSRYQTIKTFFIFLQVCKNYGYGYANKTFAFIMGYYFTCIFSTSLKLL